MINSVKSIEQIRSLYPDEWVLVGNPEMDKSEIHVLAGIPILHSKDKKEVCYFGKSKTADFATVSLVYTGTPKPATVMTGIFNSTRK